MNHILRESENPPFAWLPIRVQSRAGRKPHSLLQDCGFRRRNFAHKPGTTDCVSKATMRGRLDPLLLSLKLAQPSFVGL